MRYFAVAYFFYLGYLAKKYEIPQRIAEFALEGVGEVSRLAGREFSRGMVEVGPEIDPPKAVLAMVLARDDVWTPQTFSRDEFASERFHYEPGQHVVFGGPTQQAGKTTLAFDLLKYHATIECPAYVIVSKPRDPVTRQRGEELRFRFVEYWPVEAKVSEMWDGKPRGYIIWPKFGDINKDVQRAHDVSARALEDLYAKGVKGKPGTIVCDDTVVKSKLLGLDSQMTTHIAMAGAMDLGGWYFVQKPTGSGNASVWAYGNAFHIFLSRDKDRRNRARYDEIGGIDRGQVAEITLRLKPYQFLYLNGAGEMCIVDSKLWLI